MIELIGTVIVAIHLFFGLRSSNFTVAIGFGMVATTICLADENDGCGVHDDAS